jgi:hypothetical protein
MDAFLVEPHFRAEEEDQAVSEPLSAWGFGLRFGPWDLANWIVCDRDRSQGPKACVQRRVKFSVAVAPVLTFTVLVTLV